MDHDPEGRRVDDAIQAALDRERWKQDEDRRRYAGDCSSVAVPLIELGKIEALLPETFFADSTPRDRIEKMVQAWQAAITAYNTIEQINERYVQELREAKGAFGYIAQDLRFHHDHQKQAIDMARLYAKRIHDLLEPGAFKVPEPVVPQDAELGDDGIEDGDVPRGIEGTP